MSLSWRVQNIVVIVRVYSKLEHSEFSSNVEFDRNMLSGTGASTRILHRRSPETSYIKSERNRHKSPWNGTTQLSIIAKLLHIQYQQSSMFNSGFKQCVVYCYCTYICWPLFSGLTWTSIVTTTVQRNSHTLDEPIHLVQFWKVFDLVCRQDSRLQCVAVHDPRRGNQSRFVQY